MDIQALRGFAVLIVVLNHAKLDFLPSGYLGVDIFFVISGFLITRIVATRISAGDFRVSEFFFSRAKRLLPSAYVTFLGIALLAPFFLTSAEALAFKKQLFGAVTFTANLALANQVGYFEGAAELKPLLHIWSLSVEEQYYLFLPLVLLIVPARFWLRLALATLLLSAAVCFLVYRDDAPAAFYLVQSRLWELSVGSICALKPSWRPDSAVLMWLFWPAFACVCFLPFVPAASHQPGMETALICAATLLLILRNHPVFTRGWAMRSLAFVGDQSYAFYLVHWPVIAIFNNLWIGKIDNDQPRAVLLALIVLSFIVACLMTRYIESPVRRKSKREPNATVVACILAASFSVVLIGHNIEKYWTASNNSNYNFLHRVNFGFDSACEFPQLFQPIPQCRNDEEPELLVWGDSFAMHLVPGLVGTGGVTPKVIQATRSFCGPLLGIAALSVKFSIGQKWGESCINFNDSVIRFLRKTDSVKIVVLASPFSQYVDTSEQVFKRNTAGNGYLVVPAGLEETALALQRTAQTLRSIGKRVVVVAPPPASGFNIARCLELLENGIRPLGANATCQIDWADYRTAKKPVLELLAALPLGSDLSVVSFDSFLCNGVTCRTRDHGVHIYRDSGHFSYEGSVLVANGASLLARVREQAR